MDTKGLLTDIKAYVEDLFREHQYPWLLYHNLAHTQQVVKHAEEITAGYPMDTRTRFILLAAAWFHDTGHLLGDMFVHEETGAQLMRDFLTPKQVDQKILDDIAKCILATKMPVHPVTLPERILCDADTWHVGTENFWDCDELVWLELEQRLGKPIDHRASRSLRFLEAHTFFTGYCQLMLNEGKRRNIEQLKTMVGKSDNS